MTQETRDAGNLGMYSCLQSTWPSSKPASQSQDNELKKPSVMFAIKLILSDAIWNRLQSRELCLAELLLYLAMTRGGKYDSAVHVLSSR